MLCDAFLFKNVICVINSRMCLALECFTGFLLSLLTREGKKFIRDVRRSGYKAWAFSSAEKGNCIGLFFFVWKVACVCVCVLLSQWGSSVLKEGTLKAVFISLRGRREQMCEVMKNNILEWGTWWDMVWGVRRILETVYLLQEKESLFWDIEPLECVAKAPSSCLWWKNEGQSLELRI